MTLQTQGIGTLAYPFYVQEYSRSQKPQPTGNDATLFILETRETWIWRDGAWALYQSPVADPLMTGILANLVLIGQRCLRELQLLREGQIATGVCQDVGEPMLSATADDFIG